MSKGLSRRYRSLEDVARDKANAAARRSGKSASDWRDARDDDFEDADDYAPEEDERLAAVTRRLARSGADARDARFDPDERNERRSRRFEPRVDPDAIAENAAALVERRLAESERNTARALENIAEIIESDRDDRADAVDGLEAVVDRLGRIETQISRQSDPAAARPIRTALARLEERIDTLSRNDRASEFEEALGGLDRRLADIARRLDRNAPERRPRLATVQDTPSRAAIEAAQAAPRAPRMPLADAIAEIAERRRSLDAAPRAHTDTSVAAPQPAPAAQEPVTAPTPLRAAEPAAPAPVVADAMQSAIVAPVLAQLQTAIADLTRTVEGVKAPLEQQQAEQQSAIMSQIETLRREFEASRAERETPATPRREELRAPLETLSKQVEGLRNETAARAGQQQALSRQMEAMRRDIEDLSQSTRDDAAAERLSELRSAVDALGRRVEASRSEAGERAGQQLVVMRQIEALRRDLEDANASPRRFENLQASLVALGRQVSALRDESGARADEQQQALVERLRGELTEAARAIAKDSGSLERIDALRDAFGALSRQVETSHGEAQRAASAQVDALRGEIAQLSETLGDLAPRASVAALESALRDLAHRIDAQRDRGVADAQLAPAERIAGELRAALGHLDPSPMMRSLREDVQTIVRRLDTLETAGDADAGAIAALAGQTREIRDMLSALALRPLPVEKIETRLFDLTQRVDALSLLSNEGRGADLGDVIKSIQSIVTAETSQSIEGFNQKLEKLATKLDKALEKSGGRRFEELGERIDRLGHALGERIDRTAARAVDVAPLENLVAKLAVKIDSALDHGKTAPAVDELGRKIERLEQRMDDPAPFQRLEALLTQPAAPVEARFAELAERIDALHSDFSARAATGAAPLEGGADSRAIEHLVRGLEHKIESALAPGAGSRDLEQMERQVERLALKLDRIADNAGAEPGHVERDGQFQKLADRIDFMHAALAARLEEESRARAESQRAEVEQLVQSLASRLNSAMEPSADGAAMSALERQIGELSRRLDRNDANGGALQAIEAKIADLVACIEDNRTVASQAAEAAVRQATQDILREAAQGVPGALDPTIERELEDMRRAQSESGQRTHETLMVVHETLERVVDRLAAFEDDISELRSDAAAAPIHVPAPRPAPTPAPKAAPRRAPPVETPAARAPGANTPGAAEDDVFDLLLEPGARTSAAPSAAARKEAGAPQNDFIAAARRAAQQAAADARAAADEAPAMRAVRGKAPARPANEDGLGDETSESATARIASGFAARKRQLLLGLGAVVLVVGAYQGAQIALKPTPMPTIAPHHDLGESGAGALDKAPAGLDKTPAAIDHAPAMNEPADAPAPARSVEAPAASEDLAPAVGAQAPGAKTPGKYVPPTLVRPGAARPGPAVTPGGALTPGKLPSGKSVGPSADNGVDPTPVGAIAASEPARSGNVGNAAAQYDLAARYLEGRGVSRDLKLAAEFFEKSAAQGFAQAQYRLGSMYEKGVGVERDFGRARKYYVSAAEAGNARAMHNLAVLSAEGNDGKPDYATASEWFRKAADLGVRDSQYNLAILHARGLGVPQSLTQSYKWFAAAASQGDADAAKKRDDIGARLDSKELAAAKALAEGFKPQTPLKEANEPPPSLALPEAAKAPMISPPKGWAKPKVSRL